MKYILILISTIALSLSCSAQGDAIPIDVSIDANLIILTIPPPYQKVEYKPIAIPRYLHTLRTSIMSEHNPSKKELLEMLESNLNNPPTSNNDGERLAYLKNICLFIYLGDNSTLQLPAITRELVSNWTADNAFKFSKEAKVVSDYIHFGDEMTVKFK